MTRTARKIARLIEALGIVERAPDDLEVRRTRAGRNMRSAGAWSWFLYSETMDVTHVGSHWPAAKIISLGPSGIVASRDAVRDIHLDPR